MNNNNNNTTSAATLAGVSKPARRAPVRKRKRRPKSAADGGGAVDDMMGEMFANVDMEVRTEFSKYAQEDDDDDDAESAAARGYDDAERFVRESEPSSDLVVADGSTPSHMRDGAARVISIVSILNIVVTAYLTVDQRPPYKPVRPNLLDLVRYGARLGFQLNLDVFGAAAILMCTEPTCCVLIFEKGRIVCSGCHKESDVVFAVNRILSLVRDVLVDRRPSYRTLKAVNFRVRNIVGQACLPMSIDVKRMMEEECNVDNSPISNSVKVTPPVLADVGLNRKNQQRRAGSTLVHRSGYLLVIGTKTRDELARAYAYVHPMVSKYFIGSAEKTFSAEDLRRYYAALRHAYDESARSPASFVVVREDATRGSVVEWRDHMKVEKNLEYYLRLARHGPLARGQGWRTKTLKAIGPAADKQLPATASHQERALIVAKRARKEQEVENQRALVNRDQSALSVQERVNLSSDLTRHTMRKASAARSVSSALAEMATAQQVIAHGPRAVVKQSKPRTIKVLTLDEARHLYKGE